MKYKIEKNTVQETLIIPLYARKLCSELYPGLYRDATAIRLLGQIDYDFSTVERKSHSLMQRFGALEVTMRQNDLAFEVRDYLKLHPYAAAQGCSLSQLRRTVRDGEGSGQGLAHVSPARHTEAKKSQCHSLPD